MNGYEPKDKYYLRNYTLPQSGLCPQNGIVNYREPENVPEIGSTREPSYVNNKGHHVYIYKCIPSIMLVHQTPLLHDLLLFWTIVFSTSCIHFWFLLQYISFVLLKYIFQQLLLIHGFKHLFKEHHVSSTLR